MPVLRTKVAIVGDAQTGKSAMTAMFNNKSQQFPKNYLMTLGVDFCVKTVQIPKTDYTVELYCFDTAGSPVYEAQRGKFWTALNAVIVVFDIAARESFDNAARWIKEVQTASPGPLKGVLVGAKADLKDFAEVKDEEARALADKHGFVFCQCSALTGLHVEAPFQHVAEHTFSEYQKAAQACQR